MEVLLSQLLVFLSWLAASAISIPDVYFTVYQVSLINKYNLYAFCELQVPPDRPLGRPQCYKNPQKEGIGETMYDASLLILQVDN